MIKFLTCVLIFLSVGCSTLMPIAGGAGGAALGAALGNPATAAAGAAAGVATAQMVFPNEDIDAEVAIAAAQAGVPVPGTAAATIHETKDLLWDLGWWYLLLFVLIPLLTKKGRGWVRKFSTLHNTVSQEEIKELSESVENLKKEASNK